MRLPEHRVSTAILAVFPWKEPGEGVAKSCGLS